MEIGYTIHRYKYCLEIWSFNPLTLYSQESDQTKKCIIFVLYKLIHNPDFTYCLNLFSRHEGDQVCLTLQSIPYKRNVTRLSVISLYYKTCSGEAYILVSSFNIFTSRTSLVTYTGLNHPHSIRILLESNIFYLAS